MMERRLGLITGGWLLFVAHASAGGSDDASFSAIAERVRQQAIAATPRVMEAYTNAIPGTKASYAMVPVPGGEFVMGSSAGDRFAAADERPAHRVKIEPFWMGKCEVTWDEYDAFVLDDIERRQSSPPPPPPAPNPGLADAITQPSLPYINMDFGMGKRGFPAIAMTQHAANKYCQWLSARTGHFCRLPTEAEWEYAARAGTTNTWYFGDDATTLTSYAWFEANCDFQYQKVGTKRPNAWGLHDMLGNVAEWVLDQYDMAFYQQCAEHGTAMSPWNKATKLYPMVVRGGSWRDPLANVRCAVRGQSTSDWKAADPTLPKSVFWMRSCDFVGFRLVRPLAVPTVEEMRRYWNNGVEGQ